MLFEAISNSARGLPRDRVKPKAKLNKNRIFYKPFPYIPFLIFQ